MLGRTTVVVAHRLSTVQNTDIIAVLQEGKVAELGSHKELKEKDSVYAALVFVNELLPFFCDDRTRRSVVDRSRSQQSLPQHSPSERTFSFRSITDTVPVEGLMSKGSEPSGVDLGSPSPSSLKCSISPFALITSQALTYFYVHDTSVLKQDLQKVSLYCCGVGVLVALANICEYYFSGLAGENVTLRVRKAMFSAILRNEISWLDMNSSTLLASRLTAEASLVKGAIVDRAVTLLQNISLVVTAPYYYSQSSMEIYMGPGCQLSSSHYCISRTDAINKRLTQIDVQDPSAEEVHALDGTIEFECVYFRYPSRPEVEVLNNFNLQVQRGYTQALVGASGSGKSSVLALICRFYDPERGHVLIDDKDIKKLRLEFLRQHIGLVQQEPALFSTSIYENIRYGKEGATEAEVVEASKVANAHGFISGLPGGYMTDVGERGIQLSGGQKQRVAIARAVLKNPGILLLDEATSALDMESEKLVQEALNKIMQDRTTIVVAHRLSTVKNVHLIAVLENGSIKEQGSHHELISKEGTYFQLLNLPRADTRGINVKKMPN
ncbi:hypothetical protein L7F22_035491 [Adiantum nelumboides]|nr:hypothetical protein [Adiantum nelumboides]